jgi:plasmid stabilization system protein ParE
MKPVRLSDDAEAEFRENIHWYEAESAGLGDRLWTEIHAAISLISTHPSIGEVVPRLRRPGPVRRILLRHFPFFLVYREYTDHIEVVALAHTSRKPNYWRGRLT